MNDTNDAVSTAGCLSAEVLAAYVDGRLGPDERAVAAGHLAACADCYELFAETVRFQQAGAPGAVVPFRGPRPAAVWLAAAAALLLVGLLGVRLLLRTGHTADVAELVRAAGPRREVEARLTGGFAYAPLRSPTRGPAESESDSLRLLAAAARLKLNAEKQPGARERAAAGVADLLLGRVEDAVPALEEAAHQEPGKAWLQSDLAAGYLARARQGHPDDLPRALEAAEKAMALDPALPEAAFNRALALEGLLRTQEARGAWQEYLKLDPASGWAQEARQRLEHSPD